MALGYTRSAWLANGVTESVERVVQPLTPQPAAFVDAFTKLVRDAALERWRVWKNKPEATEITEEQFRHLIIARMPQNGLLDSRINAARRVSGFFRGESPIIANDTLLPGAVNVMKWLGIPKESIVFARRKPPEVVAKPLLVEGVREPRANGARRPMGSHPAKSIQHAALFEQSPDLWTALQAKYASQGGAINIARLGADLAAFTEQSVAATRIRLIPVLKGEVLTQHGAIAALPRKLAHFADIDADIAYAAQVKAFVPDLIQAKNPTAAKPQRSARVANGKVSRLLSKEPLFQDSPDLFAKLKTKLAPDGGEPTRRMLINQWHASKGGSKNGLDIGSKRVLDGNIFNPTGAIISLANSLAAFADMEPAVAYAKQLEQQAQGGQTVKVREPRKSITAKTERASSGPRSRLLDGEKLFVDAPDLLAAIKKKLAPDGGAVTRSQFVAAWAAATGLKRAVIDTRAKPILDGAVIGKRGDLVMMARSLAEFAGLSVEAAYAVPLQRHAEAKDAVVTMPRTPTHAPEITNDTLEGMLLFKQHPALLDALKTRLTDIVDGNVWAADGTLHPAAAMLADFVGVNSEVFGSPPSKVVIVEPIVGPIVEADPAIAARTQKLFSSGNTVANAMPEPVAPPAAPAVDPTTLQGFAAAFAAAGGQASASAATPKPNGRVPAAGAKIDLPLAACKLFEQSPELLAALTKKFPSRPAATLTRRDVVSAMAQESGRDFFVVNTHLTRVFEGEVLSSRGLTAMAAALAKFAGIDVAQAYAAQLSSSLGTPPVAAAKRSFSMGGAEATARRPITPPASPRTTTPPPVIAARTNGHDVAASVSPPRPAAPIAPRPVAPITPRPQTLPVQHTAVPSGLPAPFRAVASGNGMPTDRTERRGILSDSAGQTATAVVPARPQQPFVFIRTVPLAANFDGDDVLRTVKTEFPTLGAALDRAGIDSFLKLWAAVPKDYWGNGPTFQTAMQQLAATKCPYDPDDGIAIADPKDSDRFVMDPTTGKLKMVAHILAHVATPSAGSSLIAATSAERFFPDGKFITMRQEIADRVTRQNRAFANLLEQKAAKLYEDGDKHTGSLLLIDLSRFLHSKASGFNAAEYPAMVSLGEAFFKGKMPVVRNGQLTEKAAKIAKALKIKTSELQAILPGVTIVPPKAKAAGPVPQAQVTAFGSLIIR